MAPTTGAERRLFCFPLVFLGCLLLFITSLLCPVEVIWFLFLIELAVSLPSPRVKIYMWRKKSWSKPSRPSFCGFWSQSLWLESPRWAPNTEAEKNQSCSTYLNTFLQAPCAHRRVFVLYSHWISSLACLTVTKIISFSVRLKEINFSVPTYLKIHIFLPFLKSSLTLLQHCACFMFWFFGHKACRILTPQPGIELSPFTLEGKVLTTGPPGKSLRIFLISLLIGSGILGYKVIPSQSLEVTSPSFSCVHILPVKHDVNLVLISLCVGWCFFPFEAFRIFELQTFHQLGDLWFVSVWGLISFICLGTLIIFIWKSYFLYSLTVLGVVYFLIHCGGLLPFTVLSLSNLGDSWLFGCCWFYLLFETMPPYPNCKCCITS